MNTSLFKKLYSTIRGRILLSFFAFFILASPFILFSYNSVQKINKVKALREQVVVLNVNRVKAANVFSFVLSHKSKKDAFYQNSALQNLEEYTHYINLSKNAIRKIKSFETKNRKIFLKRIENINDEMELLNEEIIAVTNLQKERGFRDFGTEGLMRKYIHRLESDTLQISLAEVLSLRRREKDFFLRKDTVYVNKLNKECNTIISRLKQDLQANNQTVQTLADYQSIFNQIVELETKIGNGNIGLTKSIYGRMDKLDNEVSALYDIVDSDYKLTMASIQSYIILFSLITIVFSILFAYLFSNHISRPINRLIWDMDGFDKNNFEGKKNLETSIEVDELKKLTNRYNALINEIRNKVQSLNAVNKKLEESENELKEASKVKDKFFSIISHDLRGHTGNVVSLAKILAEDKGDISEKEKSTFTKYLIDSSQNLQLLLDNLLNWAKSQMNDHELSKKAFDIVKLAQNNIDLFEENAYRKNVSLRLKSNDDIKAYADKDMIDFVLRNLLSNALKFTKSADQITVEIEEEENIISIRVKDTGVGMTQSQIEILLQAESDSTFTTKGTENEVGTGLGFSICKDFVKRNRGQISIESVVGEGSNFSFTVPKSLTKDSILKA